MIQRLLRGLRRDKRCEEYADARRLDGFKRIEILMVTRIPRI